MSSRWESVPFDILMLQLLHLDLENRENISRLCADQYIRSRLQCDDPNGFLWKYLYTHKLSETLPTSATPTLKDRYLQYLDRKDRYGDNLDSLFFFGAKHGYDILVRSLLAKDEDLIDHEDALIEAGTRGTFKCCQFPP